MKRIGKDPFEKKKDVKKPQKKHVSITSNTSMISKTSNKIHISGEKGMGRRYTIYIIPKLLKKLRIYKASINNEKSISEMINEAISEYLKRNDKLF